MHKFLLGAGLSASQVEGFNSANDYGAAETIGRLPQSGKGTDFYHRYSEDFSLAKDIGLNAIRISIEWSRIEPREGVYNREATEQYRRMLQDMKAKGLQRVVTLHHYTLPVWIAERGGFATSVGVKPFVLFAQYIAEQLGNDIDLWLTINEPEVYLIEGYIKGTRPPFKKNILTFLRTGFNLLRAHNRAFREIKRVIPQAHIGLVKNCVYYMPNNRNHLADRMLVWAANFFGNHLMMRIVRKHSDFIGLNYYFSSRVAFSWRHGFREVNRDLHLSDMGYRTWPEGLYWMLKDLARYKLPIYITENGIANATSDMQFRFISEHISWATKALHEGVDVRGYFYWSLTDTYEFQSGYDLYFGLIEIDRNTLARHVREGAKVFKTISVNE